MIIRIPKPEDYPKIEELAKKYDFPLPDSFVRAFVTEVGGEVTSFCVLRHNIEALFYRGEGKKTTVLSIDHFVSEGSKVAKALGHKDVLVFAQDEQFAQVLERRYKFRRAKGVPLILDLDNE